MRNLLDIVNETIQRHEPQRRETLRLMQEVEAYIRKDPEMWWIYCELRSSAGRE